jgi:DNA-binding transcriptional LysR family regulator
MRLEILKEFHVVAKRMNLSSACKELHITQSGLSKHISDLEKEIGIVLFNRLPKGLELTIAGSLFLEETEYMLTVYNSALKKCRELQANTSTSVKLRIQELFQNTAMKLLFKYTREYISDNPSVEIEFHSVMRKNSVEAIQSEIVDVAVGVECIEPDDYVVELAKKRSLLSRLSQNH